MLVDALETLLARQQDIRRATSKTRHHQGLATGQIRADLACGKSDRPRSRIRRNLIMNCYYCVREARQTTAVGICRWCGSAVCAAHARQLRRAPVPAGVAAAWARPVQMVCTACLEQQHLADNTPLGSSREGSTREAVAELPDAAAAVRTAELILRGEETPAGRRTAWWDRLGSWLGRR